MGAILGKLGGKRPLCQHNVVLPCKDAESAQNCIGVLKDAGLPGAMKSGAALYEFGLEMGSLTKVFVVEKWYKWEDLDEHLKVNIVPNLEVFNGFLVEPFDPAKNTARINLEK
jgi:hypothetical protein